MTEKKLLRSAAYWLNDYANVFSKPSAEDKDYAEQIKRFRDKLRKLAEQCRKAGRA